MEFHSPLFQIEVLSLLHSSGKSFEKGLGSKVNLSTFHSHTDGQAERTIHTLEDMLRVCVIDFNEKLG